MASARLEAAYVLARKCWEKAESKSPEFVERYLELAEQLLESKRVVTGDLFKSYCADNGLFLPGNLHPNTWVSGVRVLKNLGWITPIGKVEPVKNHNHMNDVMKWRSEIFVWTATPVMEDSHA